MQNLVRARIIWIVVSSLVLVLVLGAWFDTDARPDVLDKYQFRTLVKICLLTVWGFLGILYLRFLVYPQEIMADGRSRTIAVTSKIKITLLIGVLGLVAAEGVLQWRHRSVLAKEFTRRQDNPEGYDPFLQVVPKRGDRDLHINRWGFRGEDIDKVKPSGTYRIFLVGGSTVYSSEVDFEQSHPRVLEKALRKRFPDVGIEVQNAGMHWHTSQHSLMKILFNIQDFDPDLLIVYHGINDLIRSCSGPQWTLGPYRSDYGHFLGPVMPMVEEYFAEKPVLSLLVFERAAGFFRYHWFADVRDVSKPGAGAILTETSITRWPSLSAFERNMESLAQFVGMRGMDLIIASQPYLYRHDLPERERISLWFPRVLCRTDDSKPDIPSMIRGMEAFNAVSRRVAAAQGALFVDLEQVVPKTHVYFLDDVHNTEEGNRVIGEHLAEWIGESGLIAPRVRDDDALLR